MTERVTRVVVGHRAYRVDWAPVDDSSDGEFLARRGVVRVDPDGDEGHLAEVLMHELLHVLVHDSGLSLPEPQEEQVVSALAPRLLDFLSRNPRCAAWLIAAGSSF
ncbi:MAG: hypothetical protein QN204_04995 [Armatimonadota bacterium]|nr:hypothetical protein [Armatimonadota bacterium]